jgi:hypothetical protein
MERKMETERFNVVQFFVDESYEYVRRNVSAEEAVRVAIVYSNNVAALIGTTRRVIITDGGDFCNFEWKYGSGVVFPTKEDLKNGS